MKFILFNLFFLFVLICSINSGTAILETPVNIILHFLRILTGHKNEYKEEKFYIGKKFNGTSIDVKFNIEEGLDYQKIERYMSYLKQKTCLIFIRAKNTKSSKNLFFKKGQKCGIDIIVEGGKFRSVIFVNDDCMDELFIQKQILELLLMRSKIAKFIEENKSKAEENSSMENRLDILNDKYLTYDSSSKQLSLFTKISKSHSNQENYDFSKLEFQLRDANEKLTFEFLRNFTLKFCKDACTEGVNLECENGGFNSDRYCYLCECPRFIGNWACRDKLGDKNKNLCGNHLLTAKETSQTKTTNFPTGGCFYNITAPQGSKISLKFKFPEKIFYGCKEKPLIEIWLDDNIYTGGQYPCGKLDEFSINSTSNSVSLYFDQLYGQESMNLEYKTI